VPAEWLDALRSGAVPVIRTEDVSPASIERAREEVRCFNSEGLPSLVNEEPEDPRGSMWVPAPEMADAIRRHRSSRAPASLEPVVVPRIPRIDVGAFAASISHDPKLAKEIAPIRKGLGGATRVTLSILIGIAIGGLILWFCQTSP
jgi:hypothetical protein